jgi:hypothetical protein
MSAMSDIYTEIQIMLEQGHSPQAIAQVLEVPVSWVYEVYEQLTEDMPEPPAPTEDELDDMADYYSNYSSEQYHEFD